jgi:putative transposase
VARRPRLALAGELHLVLLRGHNDQAVFADDEDRASFLGMLREAAQRQGVAVHAYALLPDQVHLLLTPPRAEALGRMVQSIGRRYVAAINRRHGRRGTLWDGRFRSAIVDAQTLLIGATVYVETLPVVAGLVPGAADWPWSSAAHHTGKRHDTLVQDHPRHWQLGNTPFERQHAHTAALTQAVPDARFADAVRQARALGPPQFLARVAGLLERPLAERARGRPRGSGMKKIVPN